MTLFVVRHGQTEANRENRYLGALDPPLTEEGVRQARALARLLPVAQATIVSSPLLRARQTADLLSQHGARALHVMPEFRERHVGVYEGLTQAEAQAAFPRLWARDVTRRWKDCPDGGETIEEVFVRVAAGLELLRSVHAGDTVILVAHGFVAKVIRALLAPGGIGFFEYALSNAEYAQYGMRCGASNRVPWPADLEMAFKS